MRPRCHRRCPIAIHRAANAQRLVEPENRADVGAECVVTLGAKRMPLQTSRRWASVSQSAQGSMWLARGSAGGTTPVTVHRPSHRSRRPCEEVLPDMLNEKALG